MSQIQLLPSDLNKVVAALPGDISKFMRVKGSSLVLGGGFIRDVILGEKPLDLDFFAESEEKAESYAAELGSNDFFSTKNAITIRFDEYKIQFITGWTYAGPGDVISKFDFTICQAAFWSNGYSYQSLCSENFYPDLFARRLRYTSPLREEEPAGSLIRVIKFVKRGFHIPDEDLGKVVARATEPSSLLLPNETHVEKVVDTIKKARVPRGGSR